MLSGHMGRHIDRFGGVHDGYSISHWSLEGIMLLEFCLSMELCMV